jgi:hypothetical protein
LLILSQIRQARLGNEDRESLCSPGIAFDCGGLARDPFFAQQAGEQREGSGGGCAQRGDFY